MFGNIFTQTYYGNKIWQLSSAMILIFLAIIIGKILHWFSGNILKKLTEKTDTKLDEILIKMAGEPLIMVCMLTAIWYSLKILTFHESVKFWIGKVYYILLVINIAWLIDRTVNALIENYIVPLTKKSDTKIDDLLLPLARNIFHIMVWVLAVIVGLNNAGYDVGAILAGLGVGGIAVAMAAKDTLTNILGGVTIMASRPFKVGDRIQINGLDAIVREIGMRSSRLEEFSSKRIITMPNSHFSDKAIVNVSSEPLRWLNVNVRLSNRIGSEKAEIACKIMENVVIEHENTQPGYVCFGNFEDFSLCIELKFGVINTATLESTQTDINLAILKNFELHQIKLAELPQINGHKALKLRIRNFPNFNVNENNNGNRKRLLKPFV